MGFWLFVGCGPARQDLHLVVDAGSSGTRFCLFTVTTKNNGRAPLCESRPAAAPFDRCHKVEAADGLADLNPKQIQAALAEGLASFPAEIRDDLDAVLVLGTGGFRRQTPALREAALDTVREFFQNENLSAKVHVEAITGQTEAQLAWETVRQMKNSTDHAVLETGGATVQLATGQTAESKPFGMNETFKQLKRLPGFKACYVVPGQDRAPLDFAQCYQLLRDRIFAPPFWEQTRETGDAASPPSGPLYGLGKPWGALFGMGGKDALTLAEMEKLGAQYCAKSIKELEAAGIPAKHTARNCYLWAYQTALFASTGRERIRQGGESWPRGAAASAKYFPRCAAFGQQ